MKRKIVTVLFLGLLLAVPVMGQGQQQDQEQACIPQFVNGVLGPFRWQTTLILNNQDQDQAQVMLRFFDPQGQPMDGFMLRDRGGKGMGQQVGAGGQFDPGPMNGRATHSYRSGGEGALQAGYCIVESPSQIRAHAVLQLYGADDELISETTISPARFRAGNFYADQTEGKGVGFAFANSSPEQTANCLIELFEEGGVTPIGSSQLQLGPGSQTARFLFELFPNLLTDDVGFVRITCDNPICALALQLRGLQMLQIPIFVDDEQITP